MQIRQFYAYILANRSHTLYFGVTNNLRHRVWQHKQKKIPGFTATYNVTRLVYFEIFINAWDAIKR